MHYFVRDSVGVVDRCSAHVTRDECLGVSRLRFASARARNSPAALLQCGARDSEVNHRALLTVLCRVYPRVHKCVGEVNQA